jgi:hypothetical protein
MEDLKFTTAQDYMDMYDGTLENKYKEYLQRSNDEESTPMSFDEWLHSFKDFC